MTVAFGDVFIQQEVNDNGITYNMQDSIANWFNNGNPLNIIGHAGPATFYNYTCYFTLFIPLNEHAPYKRGVAWSFHGDNFCEKSGGVSCCVALLPLYSHRSSVLWIQESFVVTLSSLAVGSLWLVSW